MLQLSKGVPAPVTFAEMAEVPYLHGGIRFSCSCKRCPTCPAAAGMLRMLMFLRITLLVWCLIPLVVIGLQIYIYMYGIVQQYERQKEILICLCNAMVDGTHLEFSPKVLHIQTTASTRRMQQPSDPNGRRPICQSWYAVSIFSWCPE